MSRQPPERQIDPSTGLQRGFGSVGALRGRIAHKSSEGVPFADLWRAALAGLYLRVFRRSYRHSWGWIPNWRQMALDLIQHFDGSPDTVVRGRPLREHDTDLIALVALELARRDGAL